MNTPASDRKQNSPTEKMLAAGKTAAERHGVPLPKDFATDYEVARQFLDKYLSKPSPKAISFAEKIAKDTGVSIPAEALTDAKQLSAWIDANKAK